MAVSTPIPSRSAGQSLILEDIDWRTYSRLLRALGDRPGLRLTYDRGRLEMMSPLWEHEDDSRVLARLVQTLTDELRLPLREGGSTTLRTALKKRGLEPDSCFWIRNAPRMKGRRRLDLRRDPPPDLAIEVDVHSISIDRLAIYAALRVPEVWRLRGDRLQFLVLGTDDTYTEVAHRRSFPRVKPAHLLRFLKKARRASDQNEVIREFRRWIGREHKRDQ